MATKRKVATVYNAKRTATTEQPEETGAQRLARERAQKVIAAATEKSQEAVVKTLAMLKVSVSNALDALANQLSEEITTLKEVQEAITAQRQTLKNLHDIEAAADTLDTLLAAQDDERTQFQFEMANTRHAWNEEKALHLKETREYTAELQKTRTREEADYQYETKKRRDHEYEVFKAEIAAEEREIRAKLDNEWERLNERQNAVTAKELEFRTLQDHVTKAEETLKKEVAKEVAIATNSLKRDLEHKHTVETLGFKNDLNLKQATITTLDLRIAELQKQNAELATKYTQASDKVQQIAEKAIDGASKSAPVFQLPSTADVTNEKRR